MWYYIKNVFFMFIYLLVMSVLGIGISLIENVWIEFALSVANVILYLVIVTIYFKNEGKNAAKVMLANDLERQNMLRTGKYFKIKTDKEYSAWKGYFFGFCVALPLIICLIIHLITGLSTGGQKSTATIVASFLYFVFFYVFGVFVPVGSTISFSQFFIISYAIPLMILSSGLAYSWGAMKIFRQKEIIQEKHKKIYGDRL